MVASYSPASVYRSGGRSSVLTQVTKGVKGALVALRSMLVAQSSVQSFFDISSVIPDTPTIYQLATLPDNSFGRQWLALIQNDGASYGDCTNSLHVLTGYGTDAMGKAELQAFFFGATGHVMSLVECIESVNILARGLSENSSLLRTRLYRAYQRGRTSYFDFGHWHPEQLWDLPLPYVRQWFGISEK